MTQSGICSECPEPHLDLVAHGVIVWIERFSFITGLRAPFAAIGLILGVVTAIGYVTFTYFGSVSYSSNPTKTEASSTLLRSETTALAGKLSSGQPRATAFIMT